MSTGLQNLSQHDTLLNLHLQLYIFNVLITLPLHWLLPAKGVVFRAVCDSDRVRACVHHHILKVCYHDVL